MIKTKRSIILTRGDKVVYDGKQCTFVEKLKNFAKIILPSNGSLLVAYKELQFDESMAITKEEYNKKFGK